MHRDTPPFPVPGPLALLGVLMFAWALVTACRTPEGWVLDADREVYEIVRQRRDELAAEGPFHLELQDPTLRDRLIAGEEIPDAMDLGRCLEVAAENSREYQARRESLYLVALDLTLERWRFSVQESGTFGAFLRRPRGGSDEAGVLSSLGLERLLGTGMRILGGVAVDLVRDVGRGDGWDAVSNLSLNITQPLLMGFGEDIVREPLTQAERNVLYEARRYERFRRTFAFEVASRFYRTLQQRAVLENERQNHAGLVLLRERNEAFAEAGLLNEIQVDQARQNELAARNRVIESVQQLEALLDDFKLFLGLPISFGLALDAGDRLRLDAWDALGLELEESRVIETGLARRLDHLIALDAREDAQRAVRVAADALRAGLDLELDASARSVEGRPATFRSEGVDATLSLTFDAPFDRLPERNVYREALIAVEASERAATESADFIRAELRDSLRRLSTARESYGIQSRAVDLAKRRVESAQLNLEAGRASTRDVLEATEDLVGARNGASGALTEFLLAGLALYRDMELLRVHGGEITIDTGPLLESSQATP